MILQHLLLPKPGVCSQQDMYFRLSKKVNLTDEHQLLTFRKHGVAWFDTYFNGFSIEKWRKYTNVEKVSVTIQLKGCFEIQLFSKEKIRSTISEKEHSVTKFESDDISLITLPFSPYDEKGMFFIRLEALSDDSQFFGGYYEGEIEESLLTPINLAINICTFRREPFIKRNLDILRKSILDNPENELSEHLHVFVSDNGKTLDIPELACEKVHIVPNKNVGGAGGFTRGLIEIMHCRTYAATHSLFMDDDVVIEPEALYRTYTLLRCLKEMYRDAFIGGAMLRLDRPNIQVESGAAWYAGNLVSRKSGLDLNRVDACLYNETEEYVEYNAWWYCCTPMSLVNTRNLPMPIFIRGDDLEYGLRNMKQLILMNGICVWHEPFENKYSSFLNYYILRNLLYDNALHCPSYSKAKFLKRLYSDVTRELFYYRYKNVDLLFRGVNDFFKGVKFLKETDGEMLHQEIMAVGYRGQSLAELTIPFEYPKYEASFREKEGKVHKLIRFISINGQLLPAKRNNIVSMSSCRPLNFYRAKRVLQYDETSTKGFVVEKRLGKTVGYLLRLIPISLKILARFDPTMSRFKRDAVELMSEEFWYEYLEM